MPDAELLKDPVVRIALRTAWLDSNPGVVGGHEEGGFIVRDPKGTISIERWPRGEYNTIGVPSHQDCKYGGLEIIATFHTHPNTGPDFLQEPSETDVRAVRDDRDLKGASYLGEFVISNERVYLIASDGSESEAGRTGDLFDNP